MKILAVVTARGGSKRLPGKNIRKLAGRPLVVWSIDIAKNIPDICEILLTTDDPEIAAIGLEAGATVPWLRPPNLATDSATSVDVALHALDWYELQKGPVDGILLLQPTSPFRTRNTLLRGIELFKAGGEQPVLGVSPNHIHPSRILQIEGDCLVPFMANRVANENSSNGLQTYAANGSFYLISPTDLRAHRSMVGVKPRPLLAELPQEALDIDFEWDFQMAELIAKNIHEDSSI